MSTANISLKTLVESLAAVEALELEGMRLLRAHSGTGLLPELPRRQIKSAMIEVVEYTTRCHATVRRLKHATAVPLMVEQIGFALLCDLLALRVAEIYRHRA